MIEKYSGQNSCSSNNCDRKHTCILLNCRLALHVLRLKPLVLLANAIRQSEWTIQEEQTIGIFFFSNSQLVKQLFWHALTFSTYRCSKPVVTSSHGYTYLKLSHSHTETFSRMRQPEPLVSYLHNIKLKN